MTVAVSSNADFAARRDLGVAWMNRGHELMRREDAASLNGALDAYRSAITLLRTLPVAGNPSWANSLGAALMNQGQLLHRVHGTVRADEALAAFGEAAELLRAVPAGANPWPRRNLGGTLLNRANLLLDLGRLPEAAAAAREALVLASAEERTDPVDAELSLKARRALCDALGRLVVTSGADHEALASEASDLVDDAMDLTRYWAGRGETAFVPLAVRFFRYGTQLYRFHQPQFLAEFIRENLPSAGAEFRAIALEAIDATLGDRPAGFLTVGDRASERRREIWRELAGLRAQLTA